MPGLLRCGQPHHWTLIPAPPWTRDDLSMQAAATYSVEHRLALFGGILLLGVAAAIAARRLRVPVLVLFLGLGMFMGSDGPGGIYFDDAELARGIGIVGLVAILFEGGLTSEWRSVRRVIVPALSLSSVGVIVTAAVVGVAAYGLFDLTWSGALLLGAAVAGDDLELVGLLAGARQHLGPAAEADDADFHGFGHSGLVVLHWRMASCG